MIAAITLAVPPLRGKEGDTVRTNAEQIATAMYTLALSKLGRMDGVDFNRDWVTFTLTSGTSTYELGVDFLSKYPRIQNVRSLWRTDVVNWPVPVKDIDDFNYLSINTGTGAPRMAALYFADGLATIKVWPTPDSNYTIGCYIKRPIRNLEDMPGYDDVVYATAINLINAARDPNVAMELARMGLRDIKADGIAGWDGSVIPMERGLGHKGNKQRVDSGDILGERP
jgi:hypothetical protein